MKIGIGQNLHPVSIKGFQYRITGAGSNYFAISYPVGRLKLTF